jgi:hypothetical protein
VSSNDKDAALVVRATNRLATLKARQLLREMREQKRAREAAQRREMKRRAELGHAAAMAGVEDYSAEEVVGMLLDAKERLGHSPTQRLATRKRGEEWLRAQSLGPEGPTQFA